MKSIKITVIHSKKKILLKKLVIEKTRLSFEVFKVNIIFKLLTTKRFFYTKIDFQGDLENTPFKTFLNKVRQTFHNLFAYDFRLPLKKDLFTWWMQGMTGKVFGHCQLTPKELMVYLYHHSVLVFSSQAKPSLKIRTANAIFWIYLGCTA